MDQPDDLPAGDFAPWLSGITAAIDGTGESDVPCGSCTACCTSSQFIHIAPDETEALAHIPRALRFPAPGLPPGHVLLGFDEAGRCPMLTDGACSIYEHRPRTCRVYDCRVFPATGIELDEPDKVQIARQAARWKFRFETDADRAVYDAVGAAAAFLTEHRDEFGPGELPATPTQLAGLALEIHEVFLGEPTLEAVSVAISRRRVR